MRCNPPKTRRRRSGATASSVRPIQWELVCRQEKTNKYKLLKNMTSVCSEFLDWNLENVCSPNVLKEEKQLCASLRRFYNLSRRKSFAAFVASKQEASLEVVGSPSWCCCGCVFAEQAAIHQHVARLHGSEIQQLARAQYNHSLNKGQEEKDNAKPHNESSSMEVTAWMPVGTPKEPALFICNNEM
ncbi:thiosulfate sulfurtransferase/rhodanese-like domain-containing protein 2 [Hippocampus comes]|uniref:thiosulfate sulfurtransferase/rhodanese-like domain-containing protein 2 n=1 Tax=Hippocampus comes TaxID=109280 RepID=UPI00094E5FD2|nr:PREDICTED: thiosulfate sulfurtransferase/rhodanese-like domain-containing protein 2 [Hippocampus comes]